MDIEDLTKSQIILLTLLVSFMTSIATGIVTVALMQQAPPTVVQSVNRIIRQTVGQVASSTRATQPAAATVTQVKTVVVRDSDTISQAVESVSHSVVRLYSHNVESSRSLGLGVIINSSGLVIFDESALGEESQADIKLADGSLIRAFVINRDNNHGLAYLAQAMSSTTPPKGSAVALSTTAAKLGDMVVAIEGSSADRIRAGYVTAIFSAKDTGSVNVLETDIPNQGIVPGTPLIDSTGNLIGLSTGVSRAAGDGAFIPASAFSPPLEQTTGQTSNALAK
ncbi:serine protease [Candidatus Kaiserbacteria bacterium]|nr:serine protease [Candidatus Kaiserbacteria bacterium]